MMAHHSRDKCTSHVMSRQMIQFLNCPENPVFRIVLRMRNEKKCWNVLVVHYAPFDIYFEVNSVSVGARKSRNRRGQDRLFRIRGSLPIRLWTKWSSKQWKIQSRRLDRNLRDRWKHQNFVGRRVLQCGGFPIGSLSLQLHQEFPV